MAVADYTYDRKFEGNIQKVALTGCGKKPICPEFSKKLYIWRP